MNPGYIFIPFGKVLVVFYVADDAAGISLTSLSRDLRCTTLPRLPVPPIIIRVLPLKTDIWLLV